MALFDKMFGRGASAVAEKPQAQQRFAALKQKYQPVLAATLREGIQLQNLHVENDKLFLRGIAPSDAAKNRVWDEIKKIDASAADITADISVRAAAPAAARTAPAQTYTVKAGDSLSKISKQHYGDANEYMRIFYANRDKITDPNVIHPGQQLVIPPDDDN
jgi:nucleoid-associated protein YgaU